MVDSIRDIPACNNIKKHTTDDNLYSIILARLDILRILYFFLRISTSHPSIFVALSVIFLSRCWITTQIFMRYFPFLLPSNIVTALMLDRPRGWN
jgi:hypothetical protein